MNLIRRQVYFRVLGHHEAAGNSVDVEDDSRDPQIATSVRVVPVMNMGLSSRETITSLELRMNRQKERLGRKGSI